MHAKLLGQSSLTTHSGRQLGGEPMKEGAHEQVAWLLCSLHWLFGPQGEGEQGFCLGDGVIGSSRQRTNGSPNMRIWLKIEKKTKQRYTSLASYAVTSWEVVYYWALRVYATRIGSAWVLALVLDASQVTITIIVILALSPTSCVWISKVSISTETSSSFVIFSAICILSARIGNARTFNWSTIRS